MQVVSNASYTIGESSNLEFDPRCYNIIYIGSGDILYKTFNNGYSSIPLYDFEENVASIEVTWTNPDIIYVQLTTVIGMINIFGEVKMEVNHLMI